MNYYKMYSGSLNPRYLDETVEILRRGGVILYPTDSFYALGCDALNNRAVERVCRLREINPAKQRLSVVCDSISMASDFASIDNRAFSVLREGTPGPTTFILPASPKLAKAFKGRHEVGVRIPDNPVATGIARTLGSPLLSATAVWPELTDEVDLTDQSALFCDPEDSPLYPASLPAEVRLHWAQLGLDALIAAGETPGQTTRIIGLLDSANPTQIR